MRFGLHLTSRLSLEIATEIAVRAERLGFEDVMFHDALMARPVWPVLCDFARATERIRLGSNVTNPYLQHPAVIAANARHLDEVSSGRAVVGIGQGSHYELVGQSPMLRLRTLEEAVAVIRMLTGGDTREWTGQEFALGPGQGLTFGTAHTVPVHLGTFGRNGSRLAGRIADGIRPAGQWDPAYMGDVAEWVREGAEEVGRDPEAVDLVAQNWTCLHPDREQARAYARRILAPRLPHLGPMLSFYRVADEEVHAARAASQGDTSALQVISDATVDRFMAAGDADDLRRGLDRIADAGLDHVSFSGVLGPDPRLALEMLGEEIEHRCVAAS